MEKRPRGRPPTGARLSEGVYVLSPDAVEAAAERVVKHRTACRERYRATRDALRVAMPHLLRKKRTPVKKKHEQQTLSKSECKDGPDLE